MEPISLTILVVLAFWGGFSAGLYLEHQWASR